MFWRKKNKIHLKFLIVHLLVILITLQDNHILQAIVKPIQDQLAETLVAMKHQLLNNQLLAMGAMTAMNVDTVWMQMVITQETFILITLMVMFEIQMVITWEISAEELLILDNVNNYFRAVLFRMVPTHIKSYSFFK